MISTIIPYLLLANVPDAKWENGPEYIFSLDVNIKTEGPNNMELYPAVDIGNELKCMLKEANVLSCSFRHVEFDFYSRNLTSNEIVRKGDNDLHHMGHHGGHHQRRHAGHNHGPVNYFNRIPFEIVFDKKGVKSLVMSEDSTTDIRIDVIRSVSNLLNVGMDLSAKISEQSPTLSKSQEMINFLMGKCLAQVDISYDSSESDGLNKSYTLELVSPLPKLHNKKLTISKSMKLENCPSPMKSFWTGIIVKHIQKDVNLKMVALNDDITITQKDLTPNFEILMETIKDDLPFKIYERMKLNLVNIQTISGDIPEVRNPTTVPVY